MLLGFWPLNCIVSPHHHLLPRPLQILLPQHFYFMNNSNLMYCSITGKARNFLPGMIVGGALAMEISFTEMANAELCGWGGHHCSYCMADSGCRVACAFFLNRDRLWWDYRIHRPPPAPILQPLPAIHS